jgi:hypothetical protein
MSRRASAVERVPPGRERVGDLSEIVSTASAGVRVAVG